LGDGQESDRGVQASARNVAVPNVAKFTFSFSVKLTSLFIEVLGISFKIRKTEKLKDYNRFFQTIECKETQHFGLHLSSISCQLSYSRKLGFLSVKIDQNY
jgi:hypothetical protein